MKSIGGFGKQVLTAGLWTANRMEWCNKGPLYINFLSVILICSRKCKQNNVKQISPEGAFGTALSDLPLPGCSELFSWGGACLGKRLFQNKSLGLKQPKLQWDAYVMEALSHLHWDSNLKYLTFLWSKTSEKPAERRVKTQVVTQGPIWPMIGEAVLTNLAAPHGRSHLGANLRGFGGAQFSPGFMKTVKEPGEYFSIGWSEEF